MAESTLLKFSAWSRNPANGDEDFCFVPYNLYAELTAKMAERSAKLDFFNFHHAKLMAHGIPSLLCLGKWAVPDSYRKETYIAAHGWKSPLE